MRHIHKGPNSPRPLAKAHAAPPVDAAGASSRWQAFSDKAKVQAALLDEQYQLCGYSELNAARHGLGVHIEHIEPKSRAPQRTFEHGNLIASALHADDLGKLAPADRFGGHAKGDRYDPARFISPLDPGCRCYFAYDSDGIIGPAEGLSEHDSGKAAYTIQLLNLNAPILVNKRRTQWEELDELIEEHAERGWCLESLTHLELLPALGALNSFFSMKRQLLGPLAEQVLHHHAPALA